MSGKSARCDRPRRSCRMAQVGSFVPAEAAHIGVVDRIFTRVGCPTT